MTPELEGYIAKFRETAADIFAASDYQSVMLAVSQYWADEADDAVHYELVASKRDMPVWPHLCTESPDPGTDKDIPSRPGEGCHRCFERGFPEWLRWWDSNSDAVTAFEGWCHEAGSQESPESENALPVLLARRDGSVQFVGKPERIDALLFGTKREWDERGNDQAGEPRSVHGDPDTAWSDARAVQLFEQVCSHPDDDGPRRVLADYLLERGEARGELIATALDAATNPAAKARYDELFKSKVATWFHPLARSSPDATAVFDRGFLVMCDLDVDPDEVELIRGAAVLATVERLRLHQSPSILHPSMRALKRLGPVDRVWLEDLVASPTPWGIEHLEVVINDEETIELLRSATNLPALRELWLSGELVEQAVKVLPKAAWWSQLKRLAIADRDVGAAGNWHRRHRDLGVPWLAVQQAYTDPTDALGWELAFGPDGACEATLRGFTPHATFAELATMVKQTPFKPTLVASDHYVPEPSDLVT